MSEIKANHICKNVNCHRGSDGGRKHYYACDLCDKRANWRSVACSLECYDDYLRQVLEARSKGTPASLYPERTDMTQDEIAEKIYGQPEQNIIEKTRDELRGFADCLDNDGPQETIDAINEALDREQTNPTCE